MVSLTEEEISAWGHSTTVILTFYQYENVRITFKVPRELARPRIVDALMKELKDDSSKFYSMFEAVSNKLDEQKLGGRVCHFRVSLSMNNPISIDGKLVQDLSFEARVQPIEKVLRIPSVVVYDAPRVLPSNRNTFVEIVELGDFEITQSSNNVLITLDLSPVEPPENCHFRFVEFDFKRNVTMKEVEILSRPRMKMLLTDVDIGVVFA